MSDAPTLEAIAAELEKQTSHGIPFYAYGDNQVAVEMSHRLDAIQKLVKAIESHAQKQSEVRRAALFQVGLGIEHAEVNGVQLPSSIYEAHRILANDATNLVDIPIENAALRSESKGGQG